MCCSRPHFAQTLPMSFVEFVELVALLKILLIDYVVTSKHAVGFVPHHFHRSVPVNPSANRLRTAVLRKSCKSDFPRCPYMSRFFRQAQLPSMQPTIDPRKFLIGRP